MVRCILAQHYIPIGLDHGAGTGIEGQTGIAGKADIIVEVDDTGTMRAVKEFHVSL